MSLSVNHFTEVSVKLCVCVNVFVCACVSIYAKAHSCRQMTMCTSTCGDRDETQLLFLGLFHLTFCDSSSRCSSAYQLCLAGL